MSPQTLPVFPLNSPLLPHCQMPLQIFEKRYLDMVSHCMRTSTGFVVALLRPGLERHEVITPDLTPVTQTSPFYSTGTLASIVDFGQRDNGLLAITIAGGPRVDLNQIQQEKSGLWTAQITERAEQPEPEHGERPLQEWTDLLEQLLGFSGLQALRDQVDMTASEQVMNYLIMLLPLPAAVKQDLLESDDHALRWEKLNNVIALLSAPDTNRTNQ